MTAALPSASSSILERARVRHDVVVTLYDWMATEVRNGRNLIAVDRSGREVWRARPVLSDDPDRDCFTRMRWDGTHLTASTWSGYEVSVDPDTGTVTVLAFTK